MCEYQQYKSTNWSINLKNVNKIDKYTTYSMNRTKNLCSLYAINHKIFKK
jgi:hypothetical protein